MYVQWYVWVIHSLLFKTMYRYMYTPICMCTTYINVKILFYFQVDFVPLNMQKPSLQNVSVSGCRDVQQARCCLCYGCWAVRLLQGIGCSGAPACSPRCSQRGTPGASQVWTQPRDRPVLASPCTCLGISFVPLSLCSYNWVANIFQSPTEDAIKGYL